MGAWIEISFQTRKLRASAVAPNMGAWIEIPTSRTVPNLSASHPTWVRGLKFGINSNESFLIVVVAPNMGAWIEISRLCMLLSSIRRTQHGCVD